MAAAASMLPPVTDALSLLDVSFVNNEWHGTPATVRRSIQILVDHISVQNVQLQRVEDILAAFGNPTQQGGTVWSKLGQKADLSRVETLETQLDGLLSECAQLRSAQSAASHAHDDVVSRVELVRDSLASLEARLGLPYGSDSSTAGLDQAGGRGVGLASPSKLAVAAAGGLVHSLPTGSVMDRLSRLERRADALAEMGNKAEDDSAMLMAKLRELEPRIEVQISHLRGDIKQALQLAAASSRLEAEQESSMRVKEAEKRMLARIQSVESVLEGRVSAVSAQAGITINTELDKRVDALYDHVAAQVQRLCSDMDQLSRDKVDLSALEHYSKRVSGLFEGVAGNLADEVAALTGQLRAEVAAVAKETAAAREKDLELHGRVNGEMQDMRQLAAEVKEAIASMQETLSSTPRVVEETRSLARQAVSDVDQLHKAVAGLNTAMTSTGSALELQSNKLGQLSHKLNGLHHDLASVKDTVYGSAATAAAALEQDGGGSGGLLGGTSLLSKLANLDRAIADISGALSIKADDSLARELERRVASLTRQQDVTSEGLRSLSATAFKRSDEHASQIQRLTLAVTGNLEERPTNTAVKHMVETAALEVRERCDNALSPLWDAVRILQSGLRDAAGELKAVGASVNNLQQTQSDSRAKLAAERSSIMAALRKALDDEVGALRAQLQERLEGVEGDVRQTVEQLDLHAQLQDKMTRLTSAVEEQLSTQVAAWRAGNHQLRSDLNGKVESAAAGLAARVEAVEVTCRQHTQDLQAVTEAAAQKPSEATVREIANTIARTTSKQEVTRYSEKDDMKWQVWLEQHTRAQEHLVTQADLTTALEASARQVRSELDSVATTRTDELRRAFSSLRGEVDGRLRATASRVEVAELRIQDLEASVNHCASKKELEELASSSMSQRADRAGLEARVRQLTEEVEDTAAGLSVLRAEAVTRSEMVGELARKVDLATYLAQGSARAAAASAGTGPRTVQRGRPGGGTVLTAEWAAGGGLAELDTGVNLPGPRGDYP
ncbi:hypothetical protein CHLRE_16g687406v5 [Chlamydomonas reinhardtii]|uniref:Uncharacterized protein n=1 Tax=Chlamydomonas reinhardtii TaxID=3055 RepID=A0A2K3CW64_CHLRE|nr:uncharacterized protein CHLRE_16g687406v5 [Chlamydomonas reinhardtii]PNW72516.1 hypothetical protein CHLRE_16g687406v5 [Chlamydomonas reinhardtii]